MITVVCDFMLSVKVSMMKLINVGENYVRWYCKSRNNKALDAMKLIQGLKEKIDIFGARIDSFTSQVENLTLVKGSFAEKQREMTNEEMLVAEGVVRAMWGQVGVSNGEIDVS